jgi:hypothetical protein
MQNAKCKMQAEHIRCCIQHLHLASCILRLHPAFCILHFAFSILHFVSHSPSDVCGQDEHVIVMGQPCGRIADELVAVQVGDDRRMQPIRRDQAGQCGKAARQRPQQLAEGRRVDLQFGDAGTLSRDTQEFNVHDLRAQARPDGTGVAAGGLMVMIAWDLTSGHERWYLTTKACGIREAHEAE